MLEVSNLVKTFAGDEGRKARKAVDDGRVHAVNDVSFEVEEGQLFTMLGPSGCGKTTTLRSIAGLESPDSGTITLADRVLFAGDRDGSRSVPANQRGLGMVFQSYAIWPHMSVFDNVAFPLQVAPRGQRPSRSVVRDRVSKVLETMELGHLGDRQATKLSGGQQQRLALARAIVIEPSLLLLDEPLSNLDAQLRDSLRFELKRLQREMGITSIYVTHDQVEALALSSMVAVMRDGEIVQLGTPRDIYERPTSRFVAEFIGTSNFLAGEVRAVEASQLAIHSEIGTLMVEAASETFSEGMSVLVAARPETVCIGTKPAHPEGADLKPARILTRAFLGDALDYVVQVGDTQLRVRSNPSVRLEATDEVFVSLDPARVTLLAL